MHDLYSASCLQSKNSKEPEVAEDIHTFIYISLASDYF